MNKSVVTINDINVKKLSEITDKNLPDVISDSISKINEIEKNISKVIKEADHAKDLADIAAHQEKKGNAIESMQKSMVEFGKALGVTADGQKLLFEYSQKLAYLTKYLFDIGCASQSRNESAINFIKKEIQRNQNNVDEFLRGFKTHILENVVDQLQQQKKRFNEIETLKLNFEKLKTATDVSNNKISELDKRLKNVSKEQKQDYSEVKTNGGLKKSKNEKSRNQVFMIIAFILSIMSIIANCLFALKIFIL